MRFSISRRFISTAAWVFMGSGIVGEEGRALVSGLAAAISDAHMGHLTKAARWMSEETIQPASVELELDGVLYLVARVEA